MEVTAFHLSVITAVASLGSIPATIKVIATERARIVFVRHRRLKGFTSRPRLLLLPARVMIIIIAMLQLVRCILVGFRVELATCISLYSTICIDDYADEIIRTHRSTQGVQVATGNLTREIRFAMITTTTLHVIGMVATAVLRAITGDTSEQITAHRSVANADVVVPSMCACIFLCD